MLKLSYRNKLRFKQVVKTICILLFVALMLVSVYLIYLQRYVIYSREGAQFDFSQTTDSIPLVSSSQDHQSTSPTKQVEIHYVDNPDGITGSLKKLSGYYVSEQMLLESTEEVARQLDAITDVGAVMLDLKDKAGRFLYSTKITGAETAPLDTTKVDGIISKLRSRGFTLVARVPAFVDSSFALANNTCALQLSSGALWMDENNYYWLDPASNLVLDYLQQICKELSSLGFSEVVFDDFYFPVSGNISYTSSLTKAELVSRSAAELEDSFTGSNLTISYCVSSASFPIASTNGRIYVADASGTSVDGIVAASSSVVSDTSVQLIFLSSSRDTRFDQYSVLRPLLEGKMATQSNPDAATKPDSQPESE